MSTAIIEGRAIHEAQAPAEELRFRVAREIGQRLLEQSGRAELPATERTLTEVDNLNRLRRPDGLHDPKVLADVRSNLVPRVVEPSMPYAVSTTYQERRNGGFYWVDQSGPQVAASGLRYHKHPAAHERVVVEVAEALDVEDNLRPGRTKVLLSPRMSPKDAPRAVARAENLADDDMLRIHWADVGPDGQVRGKFMQSILVRDIPLSAWVRMLASPDNVFGKSIRVQDPESALSVMKTFAELELPSHVLSQGVVTILEGVVRFIGDTDIRKRVLETIPLYRQNQQLMRQVAGNIADRWLNFEIDLADSLYGEKATPAIERFIEELSEYWNDEDRAMFDRQRLKDGSLYMTRKLALRLEDARQNTLWAQAAVAVGNTRVTKQMDPGVADKIRVNLLVMHQLMMNGGDPRRIAALDAENTQLAASQNVKISGGCPGASSGNFKQQKSNESGSDAKTKDEPKEKGSKASKREWMRCVHCPLCDRKGVDAYIDYYPDEKKKRITCCSCKGHKEYDHE